MNSLTYLEEHSSQRSLKKNLIGSLESLAFIFHVVFCLSWGVESVNLKEIEYLEYIPLIVVKMSWLGLRKSWKSQMKPHLISF